MRAYACVGVRTCASVLASPVDLSQFLLHHIFVIKLLSEHPPPFYEIRIGFLQKISGENFFI